jgi:plastocyanin
MISYWLLPDVSFVFAAVVALMLLPSTGFATNSTQLSPVPSSEPKGFLAPPGYEHARKSASYAVTMPYSNSDPSQFEPNVISIPANMTVVWFNEDDTPHSVTVNASSSNVLPSGLFDSDLIPPNGGSFTHQFKLPGIYDYYDKAAPSSMGRIRVGDEFESGKNIDMLVGGNALPFEAGKVGRTTFSFVPKSNVTAIPPSLSITYNVTISNSTDTLYSNNFEDSDGILDLELIPSHKSFLNQTIPRFVSWGPDLVDPEVFASDGTYHIEGPVLVKNAGYAISISIIAIDRVAQPSPPTDTFLLASANSSSAGSVPFAGTG